MLIKLRIAGTCALALAAATAFTPSFAKPAPQPIPTGPGFYPCSIGFDGGGVLVDQQRRCIPLALDAVQVVKARQLLITQNPAEAGCLGKEAAMCIATLSRTLILSTRY